MPTEKLEIDIIAKGKPAEKAIKGVEKRTNELGDATKKTGHDVDGVLTRMRAGWIAVGAVIVKAIASGKEFERASIGLSREMKDFAFQLAQLSDVTATQIAGFLKSAETAGLAEEKMKLLAQQAVALGYAFPHEDAETLHDNLVMLNTTGEAQGFIVDILEQKLSAMGIAFEDIDLKALSVADKLKLVNEVVAESSKAIDQSAYKELNRTLTQLDNGFISLGNSIMEFLNFIGVFGFLTKAVATANLAIQDMIIAFLKLKNAVYETEENTKKLAEAQEKYMRFKDIILGIETQFISTKTAIQDTSTATDDLANKTNKLTQEGERLKKSMSDQSKEFKKLNTTGQDVARGLGQSFANMVLGVKTSFKDMARSILANLVKVRTEAAITQIIASQAGGGGGLGSLFSFFTSHTGTTQVKHNGGFIGSVPSYHAGMRSDERLAKLQTGEAVINRYGASQNRGAIEAMNAGYQVGGGGNVTTAEINFNVQAIDAVSFNNYLVGNKQTIENIINNSLQTNGTVRRTIKQVV